MDKYTYQDLIEEQQTNTIKKYHDIYDPEVFWRDSGPGFHANSSRVKDGVPEIITLNLNHLVSRILLIKPVTVLEVGCGFGRNIPFILKNVPSVQELHGIDISPSMIEQSKIYLGEISNSPKVFLQVSDARQLPFGAGEFDLTYTHVVLTHNSPEYVKKITSEISRVTKNWIIHIERFAFSNERPQRHRWSHMIPDYYPDFEIHESWKINPKDETVLWVLKRK